MNRLTVSAALSALCLTLTGCPQVFDAMSNQANPHSLSASRGEGYSVSVSWSAPKFPEGDATKVVRYEVFRDGVSVTTTTSTSWTDSPPYGTKHSYKVRARLEKDGVQSDSGYSNSDTGWCVPGAKLLLGTARTPRTSDTSTGWFKTYLTAGWIFHFQNLTSPGSSVEVYDWDNPEHRLTWGNSPFVWQADRSKKVWVKVTGPASLTVWYD